MGLALSIALTKFYHYHFINSQVETKIINIGSKYKNIAKNITLMRRMLCVIGEVLLCPCHCYNNSVVLKMLKWSRERKINIHE